MLRLVDDFVNAEATRSLRCSALYHITYFGPEKRGAQRVKYGNAVRSQVEIIRINERDGPTLFCRKNRELYLGVHRYDVFWSCTSFHGSGLFENDFEVAAASSVAQSARLLDQQST